MEVTPYGIEKLVKEMQSQNAELPILVTLLGIMILVKPRQAQNALAPMLVRLPPTTTLFIP